MKFSYTRDPVTGENILDAAHHKYQGEMDYVVKTIIQQNSNKKKRDRRPNITREHAKNKARARLVTDRNNYLVALNRKASSITPLKADRSRKTQDEMYKEQDELLEKLELVRMSALM